MLQSSSHDFDSASRAPHGAGLAWRTCSKLQCFSANPLSVMESVLPSIPAKRYFTIGEVGELCGVKPHVLRYWEQEFTQLRPVKRRGNRRYYQRHEVMMIRRIRGLLYDQGFTISGARNKLLELTQADRQLMRASGLSDYELDGETSDIEIDAQFAHDEAFASDDVEYAVTQEPESKLSIRESLLQIRALLSA